MKTQKALLLLIIPCLSGVVWAKSKSYKNANPRAIEENIRFWSMQQKEHALFCVDFTADEKLKKEGQEIASEFGVLQQNWQDGQDKFLKLTKRIQAFQHNVKSKLKHDDSDYAIKKDLIDHMDLEADYAYKKVSGKRFKKSEELNFWAKEHEGEAKATAYFIVDKNSPLKMQAKKIERELKLNKKEDLAAQRRLVQDANSELDKMSNQFMYNASATRMPKGLAAHEARERLRAAHIFAKMNGAPRQEAKVEQKESKSAGRSSAESYSPIMVLE